MSLPRHDLEDRGPGHFGPRLLIDGVSFRVWAPACERLSVRIHGGDTREMRTLPGGWHERTMPGVLAGERYSFVLPDGTELPDPASRFQPEDVHGPSEIVDLDAFEWRSRWHGRAWEECVLYELHIGAFTPEGTFHAAQDKLDYLAGLGITAVSIMPVADFAGRRNWGYDGVQAFAPDSSYGRPEDLQRLVDAAHARGIAVLLDVVYNHLGPEGNYLPRYAPQFFTARHQTPWGPAVNLDDSGCAPVRAFIIENALYWLRHFRLDGLRLDAVHAMLDDSPHGILEELAERVRDEFDDRPVHLVLENEHNEARLLGRLPNGAPRDYTAQWNDDIHHVLHTAATGEGAGYYSEYLRNTRLLGRAVAEGFAFQGEHMAWRDAARGQKSEHLPPTAFVSFIQNHDQVGNRAFGERIHALAPPQAVRAVASVYLLAPQVPMLFMGEEWAARQPFQFFCDFQGELADAVRDGRRNEFARFAEFADPQSRERIPDPLAESTFLGCKLRWEDAHASPHAEHLRWYRRILAVRRARIVPLLAKITRGGAWQVVTDDAIWASWRCADGSRLRVSANLCARVNEFPYDAGRVLWHEGPRPDETALGPWTVRWTLAEPRR